MKSETSTKEPTDDDEPSCAASQLELCTTQGMLFLLPVFIATAFGSGFQNIPIVAWAQPLTVLWYLDKHGRTRCLGWTLAWMCQWFGLWFGFAGAFNHPNWMAHKVMATGMITLILSTMLMVPYWLHFRWQDAFSGCSWRFSQHVFPLAWSAMWRIAALSPIGGFGNPAYTQAEWNSLVQLAAIGGVSIITYLIGWSATSIHAAYTKDHRRVLPFITVMILALVYGGARVNLQGFYQEGIGDTIKPTLRASCIVGNQIWNRTGHYMVQAQTDWLSRHNLTGGNTWGDQEALTKTTEARAAAGDQIVLWPEHPLGIVGDEGEQGLLNNVSAIAKKYGTYITAAYLLYDSNMKGSEARNMLTLIDDKGKQAFRYQKANLVPGMETGVRAGPSIVPMAKTPWGPMGGSICFDMDFESFIRQAGSAGATIMLQPTSTWGPIGSYHARDNAFRSVENGFTHIRCAHNGISGSFSPYHQTIVWSETTNTQVTVMRIPYRKHVWTIFTHFGFIFPWVCLSITIICGVLTFIPTTHLQNATKRHCPWLRESLLGMHNKITPGAENSADDDDLTPLSTADDTVVQHSEAQHHVDSDRAQPIAKRSSESNVNNV